MVDTATCAWCGAELDDVEWCEITAVGDIEPRYVAGRVECPTFGCAPCCPTCRGPVGDIHGPYCGDIMAAKLGDLYPATITRADCGPRMVQA